jgi:hypothetical protein
VHVHLLTRVAGVQNIFLQTNLILQTRLNAVYIAKDECGNFVQAPIELAQCTSATRYLRAGLGDGPFRSPSHSPPGHPPTLSTEAHQPGPACTPWSPYGGQPGGSSRGNHIEYSARWIPGNCGRPVYIPQRRYESPGVTACSLTTS